MKHIKIISVQSVSDIITNSSSEVFVINSNNQVIQEMINALTEKEKDDVILLKTEDDVKRFLIEACTGKYDLDDLQGFIGNNVLYNIIYHSGCSVKELEKNGITFEKVVDLFLPLYKDLVGKIILIYEDNWGRPTFLDTLISTARTNNLIEFTDRI